MLFAIAAVCFVVAGVGMWGLCLSNSGKKAKKRNKRSKQGTVSKRRACNMVLLCFTRRQLHDSHAYSIINSVVTERPCDRQTIGLHSACRAQRRLLKWLVRSHIALKNESTSVTVF